MPLSTSIPVQEALPRRGESAPTGARGEPAARAEKRARARRNRRWLAASAVGVLVAGSAFALRPRPVPVDVSAVRRGPLVVDVEESGTTRIKDRYVVSAPISGSLSRLAHEPGDVVKEGDALAEITPAPSPFLDDRTRSEAEARLAAALAAQQQAKAQSARARAAKELADRDLGRMQRLAASGSTTKQAVDESEVSARIRDEEQRSAEFAEKVATEEARLARATLGLEASRAASKRHIEVVAPASGKVLGVRQKSAAVVSSATPLVEIGDPTALEIVVDLLTTDAVHVARGTAVTIRGWGGEHPLEGRVRLVEPAAFTRPSALGVDEQRVNVIVSLTDPPEKWSALGDGYRVEARFVLWQAPDVVTVPEGAVFRHDGGWAVFRNDAGVARLTPIQIGHRGETDVEVTSGIASGALVLVHPGDRVADGVRVEAR